MLDSENAWYQERILWRARQHSLLRKGGCCLFKDLPQKMKDRIETRITFEGRPVLAFFAEDSLETWTVLTTQEIVSFHHRQVFLAKLSHLDRKVMLVDIKGSTPQEAKRRSSFLRLEAVEIEVWAPAGPTIFGLMGILRMFPLGSRPSSKLSS